MNQDTPAQRQRYKKFLDICIQKIKDDLNILVDQKEWWPISESALAIQINTEVNTINKTEKEYLEKLEREFLAKVEEKYKNYNTHPQKPFVCQRCGEIICVCNEVWSHGCR